MSNWFTTTDGMLTIDLDEVIAVEKAPEGCEGPCGYIVFRSGRVSEVWRKDTDEVVEALRGLVSPTAEVEVEICGDYAAPKVVKNCGTCVFGILQTGSEFCQDCRAYSYWRPAQLKAKL